MPWVAGFSLFAGGDVSGAGVGGTAWRSVGRWVKTSSVLSPGPTVASEATMPSPDVQNTETGAAAHLFFLSTAWRGPAVRAAFCVAVVGPAPPLNLHSQQVLYAVRSEALIII